MFAHSIWQIILNIIYNLQETLGNHFAVHIENYLQLLVMIGEDLEIHLQCFFSLFLLMIEQDGPTILKHLLLAHLSLDWDVKFAAATFDTVSAKTLKLPVSKDALGGGDGGLKDALGGGDGGLV